jgi:phage baseplate assembly protein W
MPDRTFLGKGWRFAVDVDRTGGVGTSTLEENVRESIHIIIGTAVGERVKRPYFGCEIHDLVFAPNNAHTANLAAYYVRQALEKWEPRITDVGVRAAPAQGEPHKMNIEISYKVRATNHQRNLVYPFYLRKSEPTT